MEAAPSGRALLSVLLVLSLVTPAVVSGAGGPDGVAGGESGPVLDVGLQPNNSTEQPQHRNPDEVSQNGDLGAVEGWLSRELAGSLRESTVQISQGEYERARGLVGDQYNDYLSQYVDVAGQTNSEDDDRVAQRLQDAQEEQREYANTSSEYQETYEAYQEAKQNGNEERARELARELDRLSNQLSATSQNLTAEYEGLGNATGEDFTDAQQQIENVTTNVSEETEQIRQAEFTQTTLSVEANASTVAFDDPMLVTGQLRAAENRSLPETVTLQIGTRNRTVSLDETGRFETRYRPVNVEANASSVSVRYVPGESSAFLASIDTVPVTIEAVTPTVQLESVPESVRYNETVVVSGTVTVDGTPVPGTQVVFSLGGRTIQTRTDSSGTFTVSRRVDAGIESGEQSMTVQAGSDGLAVGLSTREAMLTVAETDTQLSLSVTPDQDVVQVAGKLDTVEGDPLANQTVVVRMNETTVATLETGTEGRYRETLELPSGSAGSVIVSAAFDGQGTNLASTDMERTISLGSTEGGFPVLLIGGVTVVVLALGGVGFVIVRRGLVTQTEVSPEPVHTDDTESTAVSGDFDPARDASALLAALPDRADQYDDPDGVAIDAYLSIREYLPRVVDVSATATHDEFRKTVTEAMPDLDRELIIVVGGFEIAAFASEGLSNEDATRIIESAETILGRFDEN
ncbi:hypothetical protein [Haloarchaeobius sp. HME9146]|uniref:hypothetical protein n=1 Tax=Haloarchaeobius sp. HME9146 TaxID=2978732 RepID=UPI0021BF60D7|nr:hypothetical protein [Haloarchaeobius sp. HME9146]MCT9098199.1 hypothetical protein [Haloarchaeobius sp. HME9146]